MFQKKKEIEFIQEPLTAKDIKTLKNKLSEKEDLSDLKIRDLKMEEIIPQSFNGNVINLDEKGKHVLYANEDLTGDKYKTFRKSAGGRYSQDVLDYSRKNKYGKYVLIKGKGEQKIVRLIEDDELLLFQSLKLIHGIIKDKPFMLLRNLSDNNKLSNSDRYIKKNSEHSDLEMLVTNIPLLDEEENTNESNKVSVSLFDE